MIILWLFLSAFCIGVGCNFMAASRIAQDAGTVERIFVDFVSVVSIALGLWIALRYV